MIPSLLLGCADLAHRAPRAGIEGEVDCLGMTFIPLGGARWEGFTRIEVGGDDPEYTGVERSFTHDARCFYSFHDPAGPGGLEPGHALGPILTFENFGVDGNELYLLFQGRMWVWNDGEVVVDAADGSKGNGHFDGTFGSIDDATGERLDAHLVGDFDWCDHVNRADCPYRIPDDDPEVKHWEMSTPWMVDDGTASACYVVADRNTGGLQVEMQISSVRGTNVTQWFESCPPYAYQDAFVFRSGGYTGPGTYGPWVRTPFPWGDETVELPALDWELPLLYSWLFDQEYAACALVSGKPTTYLANDPGEACTYTVEAERFTLDCDSISHAADNFFPTQQGALHFEADCTLVER